MVSIKAVQSTSSTRPSTIPFPPLITLYPPIFTSTTLFLSPGYKRKAHKFSLIVGPKKLIILIRQETRERYVSETQPQTVQLFQLVCWDAYRELYVCQTPIMDSLQWNGSDSQPEEKIDWVTKYNWFGGSILNWKKKWTNLYWSVSSVDDFQDYSFPSMIYYYTSISIYYISRNHFITSFWKFI